MYKPPQIGNVNIKVLEVRGIEQISYCVVQYDDTEKRTSLIHPKSVADQKWDENFTFPVHLLQTNIEVVAVKKRTLRKDKHVARAKIPLPTLQDQKNHCIWHTLLKIVDPQKLQHNLKMEIPALGEVRIETQYTSLKQKEERVFQGIVIEDQWTSKNCGGMLLNHASWIRNPQFLLNVKRSTVVHIKLHKQQIEEDSNSSKNSIEELRKSKRDSMLLEQKYSFYVLKYDYDYWKGRRKVVFTSDEIVKVDNNFTAALFSNEPYVCLEALPIGYYVIIPSTETPISNYKSSFIVNVWTDEDEEGIVQKRENKDQIDPDMMESPKKAEKTKKSKKSAISLQKLPLKKASDWKTRSIESEWTKQSAGGGNILSIDWRKNPQFLLTVLPLEGEQSSIENSNSQSSREEFVDACIVLSQPEKDFSIGFYIIEYNDLKKKAIIYQNEVAKTDSFKFHPAVGISHVQLKRGRNYLIIPCTSEPKEAHFTLSVFLDDGNKETSPEKLFDFYELTEQWKYVVSKKGFWKGKYAGGSPNHPTFLSNPQFLLEFPGKKRTEFIIDLVVIQQENQNPIGFLTIRLDAPWNGRLTNLVTEDVFCKTEAWTSQVAVGTFAVSSEKISSKSVFVIIPSTFEPEVEGAFQVFVYSDEEAKLSGLDHDNKSSTLSSSEESENEEESTLGNLKTQQNKAIIANEKEKEEEDNDNDEKGSDRE